MIASGDLGVTVRRGLGFLYSCSDVLSVKYLKNTKIARHSEIQLLKQCCLNCGNLISLADFPWKQIWKPGLLFCVLTSWEGHSRFSINMQQMYTEKLTSPQRLSPIPSAGEFWIHFMKINLVFYLSMWALTLPNEMTQVWKEVIINHWLSPSSVR